EDPAPAAHFFQALRDYLLGFTQDIRKRVVAALVATGLRGDRWPAAAAEVCAVFHPPFLHYSWVPVEIRHAAIRGLYTLGERCPRRTDEE
ncbi:hypothetical protein Q8G41_27700, partial [Klebsiella pneumoniae]|uniref:hypothetical protein n=1 Tax=Klebsiella pneumoniae TaxID=573 RepID=UPI00301407A7